MISAVNAAPLKNALSPLILVFWLGALWVCMAPQVHPSSHDSEACASIHNAVGPQTASKIASMVTVLPVIIAVFLAIDRILTDISVAAVISVPLLERRRYTPTQPNAPPSHAFVL